MSCRPIRRVVGKAIERPQAACEPQDRPSNQIKSNQIPPLQCPPPPPPGAFGPLLMGGGLRTKARRRPPCGCARTAAGRRRRPANGAFPGSDRRSSSVCPRPQALSSGRSAVTCRCVGRFAIHGPPAAGGECVGDRRQRLCPGVVEWGPRIAAFVSTGRSLSGTSTAVEGESLGVAGASTGLVAPSMAREPEQPKLGAAGVPGGRRGKAWPRQRHGTPTRAQAPANLQPMTGLQGGHVMRPRGLDCTHTLRLSLPHQSPPCASAS